MQSLVFAFLVLPLFWCFPPSVYWGNWAVISKNKALFEEVLMQRWYSPLRLGNEWSDSSGANPKCSTYYISQKCPHLIYYSPCLFLFKCLCILGFCSLNVLWSFLLQGKQQQKLLGSLLASQAPECVAEGFIPMTQLCFQLSTSVCLSGILALHSTIFTAPLLWL